MSITGAARGLLSTIRDLDIGSIERGLALTPRVLVAARNQTARERWITELLGPAEALGFRDAVRTLDIEEGVQPAPIEATDLGLVILSGSQAPGPSEIATVSRLRAQAIPTFLLIDQKSSISGDALMATDLAGWFPEIPRDHLVPLGEPAQVRKQIATALSRSHPDLLTGLARHFTPMRPEAIDALIRDASWANSQVALLSSIPAMIPIAGGLLSSVADMIILTKNQVGLVFKIAGIYGRNLHDRMGVAMEIAPVIGGAFVWRTVARSLVALLPAPVGAIPKTIVAYTGTFAVGQLAHYYYRHGHRPPAALVDNIRREGLHLARRALPWPSDDKH